MIYRFIFLLFLSSPIFAQTIQEKLDFTAKAIKENNYKNIVVYQDDVLKYYRKINLEKDIYIEFLLILNDANSILGNYKKSLELNLEVVNLIAEVTEKKNLNYILSLYNLANNYKYLGNYYKALEINLEIVKLSEKVLGKDHPDYFILLGNLANNYKYLGNYYKSLEINLEIVKLSENVLGKEHPDYLKFLSNLASDYNYLGNYHKSLEINFEVINLNKKLLEREHTGYLHSLHNISNDFMCLGIYNKALEINLEVINLKEKVLGKEHSSYLNSLGNLASIFSCLGNYQKAIDIDLEVLQLREKILGKESPDYLLTLSNLAAYYSFLGNYQKAIDINLEVLELKEKVLGKKHPDYLLSLGNLASNYNHLGNYHKALEIDLKVVNLNKNVLGQEHPDYLFSLGNLSIGYKHIGNYNKALKINLKVIKLYEKVLGKKHPDYLLSLSNLSKIYYILKNYSQSDSIYSHLITQKTSTIHEKLIGLDNNLKEIAKNNAIDDYLRFTNYALLRQKENPYLLNQSFNTWLNLNGLLSNQSEKLRTIVEQSGDKKLLEVYEDWIAQKMQLLKYYELTIDERNKRGIDIKKQQDDIAALEQQLSKKTDAFEEFKKQHSFTDIQNKLKENEAYIDIVRLDYYDFNNDKWEDSVRYLVYVITKETKNKPMYIVLNNGKDLETDLITHYLSNNSLANKNNQEKDGVVYNNFWQPIADAIQNKKTIYTVLGGVYNNINLGTIYNPNTGKYLSEELDIRIINSGKSFVQNQNKSTLKNTKQTATLLGNPNFNANLKQKPTNYLYAVSRDFTPYLSDEFKDTLSRSVATNALPGTKTEVENIGKLMRENKWETFVLLDTLATKTQLKNVNNPRVLHLATHGYFVNNTKLKKADGLQYLGMEKKVVADNPLLRSGLLLAGANKTLQGDSTPTNDNGIFTAYEASFLNLNQTELVVLSACETGKGDIKTGEGVYGLRKSFADAGAKNIIISLWAVDDDVTQQFMTNFYTLWLNGLTIKDAFTQTQNQIKQKYPLPYYWGGFILIENN